MSLTQDLEISESILDEDVIFPPSDLYSDEPPLETKLHLRQIMLLLQCLEWVWHDRQDFYACGNLTVYYSPRQRKSEQFRGPDFFVVLGTERKPRKSWVVWEEEGKYPNVIVEILSDKTAKTDRGLKKEIYQNIFRTPDYFWFDPESLEFQGFHLLDGQYQPLQPNSSGWLWSQQLELYLGIQDAKLRLFTAQGQLIPTPTEAALQAQSELESQRERSLRLAQKLQEMGIDLSDF
ncbi:hypothetical protein C7H19_05410 [Aphanothece hegewaldii CCALA 016]|uniref:Putative restriction endonuclease domain-containing protein n=1 Tax=Aphanothece hegewaldii CCALA 016 TaxID=2107694 RepID=A0A2T1M145_9CHRO|nr:Uma2 family endonuclease [Aphanothece hegewaldii]PSF38423.1 hypothetical protein C7H19_05410 [Aphanothece hegewaldii CCALA 016]